MIRYYPKSIVKTRLITNGVEFTLNGKPYKGFYYETFDGKYFVGPNPVFSENQQLTKVSDTRSRPRTISVNTGSATQRTVPVNKNNVQIPPPSDTQLAKAPTSYFPVPLDSDYQKGFIFRYFAKKINSRGFVVEISPEEYANIQDGTVPYDISYFLTAQLRWKLIGPLNNLRISQYNIQTGIIDANKFEVEKLNKTFLGIYDFINENYTQFAKPTPNK